MQLRNIEGLLPEVVTKAVYEANADLVQAATAGTKEEQDSAKRELKTLLLEEFQKERNSRTGILRALLRTHQGDQQGAVVIIAGGHPTLVRGA